MHVDGNYGIEDIPVDQVELARIPAAPPGARVSRVDVIVRVTFAAMQSAYLRWLDDDGTGSLPDLTAAALDLVGEGFARAVRRP